MDEQTDDVGLLLLRFAAAAAAPACGLHGQMKGRGTALVLAPRIGAANEQRLDRRRASRSDRDMKRTDAALVSRLGIRACFDQSIDRGGLRVRSKLATARS